MSQPALSEASPSDEPAIDHALQDEVDEYFEAGAEVRPGDVVVDVGANVGAFAMRVAERTRGGVTVHCFEPAPVTFAALERNRRTHTWLARAGGTVNNVALTRPESAGQKRPFYYFSAIPTNSTYDLADKYAEYRAFFVGKATVIATRVEVVPLAGTWVGKAFVRTAEWIFRPENRFVTWLADRATGMSVLECETDSLESWAAKHDVTRIDLLKVDVEGAELDVLLGCGSLWPAVRSVALEAHDRDGRLDTISELLRGHGFTSIRRFRPKITAETGLDNMILVAKRD
jgi:FkbM family methyltransferase